MTYAAPGASLSAVAAHEPSPITRKGSGHRSSVPQALSSITASSVERPASGERRDATIEDDPLPLAPGSGDHDALEQRAPWCPSLRHGPVGGRLGPGGVVAGVDVDGPAARGQALAVSRRARVGLHLEVSAPWRVGSSSTTPVRGWGREPAGLIGVPR
jgi:hypothetical protein